MKTTNLILLPVYGEAPYLNTAIESCLVQSETNFLLLVLLDRPSQTSAETVRFYTDYDSRVVSAASPRAGLSATLNFGLSCVESDFVFRMDADDIMSQDRLEKQLKVFREHEDIAILGGQAKYIGANSELLGKSWLPISYGVIYRTLVLSNPMIHPTLAFRRSALDLLDGYDDEFNSAEDLDLLLRARKLQLKISNMPDYLLQYRRHQIQMTHLDAAGNKFYTSLAYKKNELVEKKLVEAREHWVEFVSRRRPAAFFSLMASKVGKRVFFPLLLDLLGLAVIRLRRRMQNSW